MARNLQAKLAPSDTLRIFDVNAEAAERFATETKGLSGGATVKVASNVKEAAQDAVSSFQPYQFTPLHDEFVLSMI